MRLDLRTREPAFTVENPLSDEDRRHAIADWRGRMVSEHISARVFAGILPQMMRAGIDADSQARVAEMIAEELRHARLCAQVVSALGAEPVAELPELPEVPAHDDVGPFEALLRNLLSISCLNETVAVAVIETGRCRTTDATIQRIMEEILADEVGHARLGWKILEDHAHAIDEGMRERLGAYLVPAFRQLIGRHLLDESVKQSQAASEIGVCDGSEATRLFLDTVAQVIIPGLEAHGIPAARAWERAVAA